MHDQKLYDKIMSKLRKESSGCWVWTGFCGSFGYGMVYLGARPNGKPLNRNAHRAMWIALHGPLTRSEFVCHKCDNPPCCNPDHLFIGSLKDNNRDMATKGRYNHQKRTHCIHGHEFTPENTYRSPSRPDRRSCLACMNILHRLSPEERAKRKIYNGSVRRGPKKYPNRGAGPQGGSDVGG
jgi:hypothetical protein